MSCRKKFGTFRAFIKHLFCLLGEELQFTGVVIGKKFYLVPIFWFRKIVLKCQECLLSGKWQSCPHGVYMQCCLWVWGWVFSSSCKYSITFAVRGNFDTCWYANIADFFLLFVTCPSLKPWHSRCRHIARNELNFLTFCLVLTFYMSNWTSRNCCCRNKAI